MDTAAAYLSILVLFRFSDLSYIYAYGKERRCIHMVQRNICHTEIHETGLYMKEISGYKTYDTETCMTQDHFN